MISAAFILALTLVAQPTSDPCLDDNLLNRCDSEVRAATLSRQNAPALKHEAASGVEVYRALFVDGYGREMPTIAFERRPNQSPQVVVYGLEGKRLTAAVSAETWGQVVSEGLYADRAMVTRTDVPALSFPAVCLHSWVMTVEMANTTVERRQEVAMRRATADACDGGLVGRYAFRLADLALISLPPCEALDQDVRGGSVGRLETCLGLEGDRLAAASLLNARPTGGPRHGLDRNDPGVWRAWMGTNGSPELEWAGERIGPGQPGDEAAATYLVARLAEAPTVFEPNQYIGRTAREAMIRGTAKRLIDGRDHRATYEQTWVWDPNMRDWMIASWRVSAFKPED